MEHRCGRRSILDVPVSLHLSSGKVVEGRMKNASLSGALTTVEGPIPMLSRVVVEVDHPELRRAQMHLIPGYVVREATHGVGIEWTEFASAAVVVLLSWTARTPPAPAFLPQPFSSARSGGGTRLSPGAERPGHNVTAFDPGEWPKTLRTSDGVKYRVRPVRDDDFERDRRFLIGLSPDSRYNRMMGFMGAPPKQLVEHLVHVDYRHDMALAAVVDDGADESIIAVARYAGDPDQCEYAIAVADEWQSRGVGTSLSQLLFEYAKSHGVRRMYATTFTCNNRMLKLARDMHMDIHAAPYDPAVVEAWRTL